MALLAKGVRYVILAYDSQPRPVTDALLQLAPEEIWTLKHGMLLADAGLEVRILRLPLNCTEKTLSRRIQTGGGSAADRAATAPQPSRP